MSREEVLAYIKRKYKVEPDFPFARDSDTAVLRHKDTGKWFALVMYIPADRLGYEEKTPINIVTMKSEPMLIDSLVKQKGFHRAYHMNKTKWLTIELDGSVSRQQITSLIDMSFELT